MAGNYMKTKENEMVDQIPDSLNPIQELDEMMLAEDVKNVMSNIGTKKTEEEKNHLKAWAQQCVNLDEEEAKICSKILADKYPDLLYIALMEQMHDLMKSRDEINSSLSLYFGKRNEVFAN